MHGLLTTSHILLAVVFTTSAAGKARPAGFRAFLTTLSDMGIRARVRRPLARLTVAAEVTAAVLLFLPGTPLGTAGLLLAALLLTALTLGVLRAVTGDGPPIACACFGRTGRPLGALHLARNAALLLAAVGALALALAASGPGRAEGGGLVVAVAAGLVLAVVVIGLDDIADLFAPPVGAEPEATAVPEGTAVPSSTPRVLDTPTR
ncbi:MauE/DoxX family redox-associated membrane protein [Kitasatospora misakiensis]|uniref:MauE/DoxX family redox-associated membrane protein n=1 Tax=Kitasatospora misakiensis TaxID=67330 RepID=A0ABW0WUF5_9ACTN